MTHAEENASHSSPALPALGLAAGSALHVWKCFHCDFQTTDMNIICNHEKESHPNEYADSLYREVFGPWE
jgi:hypothetical protein